MTIFIVVFFLNGHRSMTPLQIDWHFFILAGYEVARTFANLKLSLHFVTKVPFGAILVLRLLYMESNNKA